MEKDYLGELARRHSITPKVGTQEAARHILNKIASMPDAHHDAYVAELIEWYRSRGLIVSVRVQRKRKKRRSNVSRKAKGRKRPAQAAPRPPAL